MRASSLGRGLKLSADEVYALSRDHAIEACAENCMIDFLGDVDGLPLWKDCNPKDYPVPIPLCVSDR